MFQKPRDGKQLRRPSAKITRKAGYLLKKVNKAGIRTHHKYYFTLTDNRLLYFSKKKDHKLVGEIPLPCGVNTNGVDSNKKYAFELLPSKPSTQHEKHVILVADTEEQMNEWIKVITEASSKLFFPDELKDIRKTEQAAMKGIGGSSSDKELDKGDMNNTIQQKLKNMLNHNPFEINEQLSNWRKPISLRGLVSATSEDLPDHIYESLTLGAINPTLMLPSRALAVHNKSNLLIMGCKPNQVSSKNTTLTSRTQYGGALQMCELKVTEMEDDQGPFEDHDFVVTDSLQISDSVVSLDWQEELLVVGTNESRVLLYNTHTERKKFLNNPVPFGHNEQKAMIHTPGSWMQSSRINAVKLQRIPNPDSFLTIKNEWFYLWNIKSPEGPVNFERASTSPLYALEWQPRHPDVFIVGGVSKNLKIVDLRELPRDPSKAVPRVFRNAHDHVIRDIAWSPFVEYWIATCGDDACVKIWDTRYDYAPVRVLRGHTNSVHTVRWSKSHAEMLISGSMDRTLMLWNLRIDPHFLVHSQPFAGSVVGCDFSSVKPLQYFGLSSEGDLRSVELRDEFVEPFVPHKYDETETEKREVEKYIYLRKMREAHEMIPKLAHTYWDNQEFEKVQEVMTMVSAMAFKKSEKKHSSFEETLKSCCFHYPNDCVVTSEPEERDLEEIDLIKMRLYLNKLLKKQDSKHLVLMEPKIFEHLQKKIDCFAPTTLKELVLLLKATREELTALKWAIQLSKMFAKAEKYDAFIPIAHLLLRPTIYDSAHDIEANASGNDGKGMSSAASVYSENPLEDNMSSKASSTGKLSTTESKHASPLYRRAQAMVEKEFRKPSAMEAELELLYQLQRAAEDKDNPAFKIVETVEIMEQKQQEVGSDINGKSEKTDASSAPHKSRATIFTEVQEEKFSSSSTGNSRGNTSSNLHATDTNTSGVSGGSAAGGVVLQSLTQKAYRMYLEALLQTGNVAQFFIVAIRLMNRLQGFEFAKEINEWITTNAFNQFKVYLDTSLEGTYKKPKPVKPSDKNISAEKKKELEQNKEIDKEQREEEVLKIRIEGLLSLVKLCTSLTEMPVFLQNLMPKYLKDFKQELKFSFNTMSNRGYKSLVKEYVTDLTKKISTMDQNKLVPSAYFQTDIDELCKELSRFGA